MELFLFIIGALGFFGLLLMIRGNQDNIKRLQIENLKLKSEISQLEFKLNSETIKNNLRAINSSIEKSEQRLRGIK